MENCVEVIQSRDDEEFLIRELSEAELDLIGGGYKTIGSTPIIKIK